jgi:hypothetical protein
MLTPHEFVDETLALGDHVYVCQSYGPLVFDADQWFAEPQRLFWDTTKAGTRLVRAVTRHAGTAPWTAQVLTTAARRTSSVNVAEAEF